MRIQASLVATLVGVAICATTAFAAPPGPVHDCGTFVSYTPPSPTVGGRLVIGSTTYEAAWMGSTGPAGSTPHTFNQVIASGVTPGSQACLDGTIVTSHTQVNLLTDFVVSRAPTTGSALPTTGTGGDDWSIPVLVFLAASAIAAVTVRSRLARPASPSASSDDPRG